MLFAAACGSLLNPALDAAEEGPETAGYPPKVQPASGEAELAMRGFRLPRGLKVELAAAEPLVANPVSFAIDEHGRFYVVETFRLHAGVTDIRGHMDWLDEELAVKTVEERVAYMTRHEGKRIADYTKQSDRLRLVWDSDGDGKADRATVFADGFNGVADGIAAGVLVRTGQVYFANIPNLWLLRDTKGTGRADVRTSLSYGYGVRVGFLGHDVHGLRFGPDGRLYFSIGDRGASVKTREGRVVENLETGVVYRCDPDGSNLEIYASGLRNPQELVFDQFGNLWTGDNNSDGGDPARWVYVVEGGDSGWRIGWQFITSPNSRGPWLAERMCYPQFPGQAAYIVPPIATIANGPSGLTYHPGTGLNARYQDRFFLCDFRGGAGSGVHSFGVKPRGAGFELIDRTDFIWEILATDCDFGYDGCFYVSDWVSGWNQTGKGRIYRVFDPETRHSAAVEEVTKLFAEGFAQRPAPALVRMLDHADQRVRQEAQFGLVALGQAGLKPLVSTLDSASIAARLHAVWGLGQLLRSSPRPVAPLLQVLKDPDPEVRGQAAKVLGDARIAAAQAALLKLLEDPSPRPRFFAALALARLGRAETVPAVLAMLRANDNQDAYLRHAGVMALVGCADPKTLVDLAADASPALRLAAVVALRRLERPEVGEFLHDTDATVVLEAARAVNDLPLVSALPKLASLVGDAARLSAQEQASRRQREAAALARNPKQPDPDREPDVLFRQLLRRAVNAHFRLGQAGNAEALAAFALLKAAPAAARSEAIDRLAEWGKPSGRDNVTGLWRPLERRDPALAAGLLLRDIDALLRDEANAVKVAVLRAVSQLGVKQAAPALAGLVSDRGQPAEVRTAALKTLAGLKSPGLAEALQLAASDPSEALRNEAMQIQGRLKPSDVLGRLKAVLDKGSVREKQNAFLTLATLKGGAADELLGQWMDRLLARQVPPELQLDLVEAAETGAAPGIKDRVTAFERSRPASDDLRAYRECLQGGNAEEGRKIFLERVEVSCVRCHKARGEGGEVGPDLTGVGQRKPREYILESITFPNKQIAAGFENVLVTMKNGALYAGLLKAEDNNEIELNSPEDGLLKLKKAEIKSRERGLSSMPEELRQVLSKQDLRNLVEFLATLQ